MVLTSVLAQMWDGDNHMSNGWWWVMGVGWLVFLGLLVGLVYLIVRHNTGSRAGHGSSGRAVEILDERFARGEIDEPEYRSRRDALGR